MDNNKYTIEELIKLKIKHSPDELMRLAIDESYNSVPEHKDKADPLVGAIIATKDGEILAAAHRGELREGEHCEYTLIERKLKDKNLKECQLYVTLEPCIDEARKHPKRGCATHITKARINTVYIGMRDPNPKVENIGATFLRKKGIKVIDFPSPLEEEIRKSNSFFIKEMELLQMQLDVEKEVIHKEYLEKIEVNATINQFNEKAINKFLISSGASFVYPSSEFIQWALGFGLLDKDSVGLIHPTKLGLILFHNNAEDIYPHTLFKVEVNYDSRNTEIKDFGGPIVNQLVSILDFIKDKALKLTIDRSGGQRIEQSDFPVEILREAIANAIIHRDYEDEKSTNYLSISSNKIIVRSPGSPEFPLTLDDLKTFDAPSVSRNPKIMFVFNKMGFAEQRGIGLRNMKQLNELGFPLPIFELKAGMLQITFGRNKEFIAEYRGVDSKNLSEEDKEGLLFIQEKNSISVSDYASHFNIEIKTANRRLGNLVEKGLLDSIGDNRGRRYRLK